MRDTVGAVEKRIGIRQLAGQPIAVERHDGVGVEPDHVDVRAVRADDVTERPHHAGDAVDAFDLGLYEVQLAGTPITPEYRQAVVEETRAARGR